MVRTIGGTFPNKRMHSARLVLLFPLSCFHLCTCHRSVREKLHSFGEAPTCHL